MYKVGANFVSIVIPTFNNGSFLKRALNSVFRQTYDQWELIVVDNHSTDDTDEVIASFPALRIKYIKVHNNGVIAVSRNIGTRSARGNWIAFLDSDDWWDKDKLKLCVEKIGDKVDIIYHDLTIVPGRYNPLKRKNIHCWQVEPPVLTDLLVRGNAIATSSVMVRAKHLNSLGGMDESGEMVAAEDYNMWLRIAQITDGFLYLPQVLGYYQVHDKSVSKLKDMSIPARSAVKYFSERLSSSERRRLEANILYTKGRFEFLSRNRPLAKKYLLISLRYAKAELRLKSLALLVMLYASK